jgi:hypothetical protein
LGLVFNLRQIDQNKYRGVDQNFRRNSIMRIISRESLDFNPNISFSTTKGRRNHLVTRRLDKETKALGYLHTTDFKMLERGQKR